jgi:hypothetical protein
MSTVRTLIQRLASRSLASERAAAQKVTVSLEQEGGQLVGARGDSPDHLHPPVDLGIDPVQDFGGAGGLQCFRWRSG